MTKPQSVLEMTRHDAQDLHKKIAADMADAGHATWAKVKAVQADAHALATKMKAAASDQADAGKASFKAAIAKLEASAKLVEDKATDAKDAVTADIHRANAALLDSSHRAALSLSAAVAEARTKLAKAIAPKKAARVMA